MQESKQIDLLEAFELCHSENGEKKTLISSLLYFPWECSDELVVRYRK